MLGVILGLIFGCMQLFLLMLAVNSLGEEKRRIWPMVVQFFCPILALGLCIVVARENLLICAVVMSTTLIVGAGTRVLRSHFREKRGGKE